MTMIARGAGAGLPAGASTGQVLQWNGSAWVAATPSASGTTPNATPTVPGLVQLAGDLGGTATAPTVPALTGKADKAALAAVATSGAYTDLTGRPALAAVATSGAYTDLTGRPTLATVATSGSYGDLAGRPALATVATTGAYGDLTGRPTVPTEYFLLKTTATVTTSSALANDSAELTLPTLPVGTYGFVGYMVAGSNQVGVNVAFTGGTATVTGSYNNSASLGFTGIGNNSRLALTGYLTCTAAGSWAVQVASQSAGSTAGLTAGSWLRLTKMA